MADSGMEVDPPSMFAMAMRDPVLPSLKRSNSAPMINMLASSLPSPMLSPSSSDTDSSSTHTSPTVSVNEPLCTSSTPQASTSCHSFRAAEINPRVRRFSASYAMGLQSPTGVKTPSRLNQIKLEEAVAQREVASERELQSQMSLTASWEDLSLEEPDNRPEPMMTTENKRPKSFGEPLHIFTSPFPYSSSPSPTRVGKQCFSPHLQQAVKNPTLSPSPSPTRKSFARRSLSPIALRPSPLSGIKRKADFEDGERMENYFSPPKRAYPGTPERLQVTHPLIHCISMSSMEEMSSSPEQQVPNAATSSVSAISTLNVPNPSCFNFRPVHAHGDHHSGSEHHGSESEASDMTEVADINDVNDDMGERCHVTEHCHINLASPPAYLSPAFSPKYSPSSSSSSSGILTTGTVALSGALKSPGISAPRGTTVMHDVTMGDQSGHQMSAQSLLTTQSNTSPGSLRPPSVSTTASSLSSSPSSSSPSSLSSQPSTLSSASFSASSSAFTVANSPQDSV